jgi:hypothetical protein
MNEVYPQQPPQPTPPPTPPQQAPQPLPTETTSSRRRRYVAIAVTTIVIIALIALWYYISHAPAVGVIRQGKPTPTQSLTDKNPTLVPYTANPYMKYSYLSSYRLTNTDLQSEGVLSRAFFTAELPANVQYNVYTQKFTGFDQDGAVHFRETFPQYYTKEVLNQGGISGLIFTRTDQNYERVAFIAKGNLETVVAMTVNQQNPQNMIDFNRMLATFSWKQ